MKGDRTKIFRGVATPVELWLFGEDGVTPLDLSEATSAGAVLGSEIGGTSLLGWTDITREPDGRTGVLRFTVTAEQSAGLSPKIYVIQAIVNFGEQQFLGQYEYLEVIPAISGD